MSKINILTVAMLAILGVAVAIPVSALYEDDIGSGDLSVTPEQIKRCKELGIPEFTCTQQAILAKLRYINANQPGAGGSGTPLFAKGFGEMGAFVAVLGALFGGVAAAFFARARIGKKVPI